MDIQRIYLSSCFAQATALIVYRVVRHCHSNLVNKFPLTACHNIMQGTVIIIANHGERIDIPAGALLENKIVSGNLRILDH